jgi:hypothetical protein
MAHWTVAVFDEASGELVAERTVAGVRADDVRRPWGVPSGEPLIGEMEVATDAQLAFLNAHLTEPVVLDSGQSASLGLTADFPGEHYVE